MFGTSVSILKAYFPIQCISIAVGLHIEWNEVENRCKHRKSLSFIMLALILRRIRFDWLEIQGWTFHKILNGVLFIFGKRHYNTAIENKNNATHIIKILKRSMWQKEANEEGGRLKHEKILTIAGNPSIWMRQQQHWRTPNLHTIQSFPYSTI